MRMLKNLREHMDEIEADNEWEHKFVTDMLIRKEENPEFKPSEKQFSTLVRIHQKYVE